MSQAEHTVDGPAHTRYEPDGLEAMQLYVALKQVVEEDLQ